MGRAQYQQTGDLFDATHYPHVPGCKTPGTSQQAADEMVLPAQTLRADVLRLLQRTPGGLTADECAELLHKSELAIRPRLSELRRQGRIHATGERRTNQISGKAANVWMADDILKEGRDHGSTTA